MLERRSNSEKLCGQFIIGSSFDRLPYISKTPKAFTARIRKAVNGMDSRHS